jgi:putative spermidine/putrescine transport system permease protein
MFDHRNFPSSAPVKLLAPALILIVLLFVGGLVLGLLQALGHTPGTGLGSLTLNHFVAVFTDPDFTESLLLSLVISMSSTFSAAIISIFLAPILVYGAKENRLLHFVLQIPLTVPHLVAAVSFLFLLSPAGIVSRLCSFSGLIGSPSSFPLLVNDDYNFGILMLYTWKEVPFITFMLLAVLTNTGTELNEAGATLNGSKIQRFRYITLPILWPSLGGASLIVFAFTFGAFEVPYLLGKTYPVSLPVWSYKQYSDIDLLARPEGIAIGLIIAALVAFLIMFSQLLIQYGRRKGMLS